jgi:hypothetical protein
VPDAQRITPETLDPSAQRDHSTVSVSRKSPELRIVKSMFKVRKLVDDDVLEHPFSREYEAHGKRLWATRCEPRGALFQFTIPAD